MFVVAVTFEIDPEHVGRFIDLVRTQARNSLTLEPGCHQFDVCIAPQDSMKIFLYELYSDENAFNFHLASDHFKQFNGDTANLVRSKSVSTLKRIEP
jgi:autoinducer 2-degrading protein